MRSLNIRKLGVASPILIGALVLASCGSDTGSGAVASTQVDLDTAATNYIVKDPVTTTIAPLVTEIDPIVSIASGSQVYVVQSGDYPLKVADQFDVPLEVLLAFNGWATGSEFPFPGQDVLIPPGAVSAAVATAPSAAEPATEDDSVAAAPVGETIPDSGSNCPAGQYTIEASDTARTKVAEKFDVTVDALDAANAGTSGYGAFYPGLKIVIPAKADC
jgi:LysM repeat protein